MRAHERNLKTAHGSRLSREERFQISQKTSDIKRFRNSVRVIQTGIRLVISCPFGRSPILTKSAAKRKALKVASVTGRHCQPFLECPLYLSHFLRFSLKKGKKFAIENTEEKNTTVTDLHASSSLCEYTPL